MTAGRRSEGIDRNLDLSDAGVVRDLFEAGAQSCRSARCRQGSIEVIHAPGRLIATGDLHDNPLHLMRLVGVAGMDGLQAGRAPDSGTHLVLHEIIHSDRLLNGMDFSYRALARVAALKAQFPERIHVLLANHELAQLTNAGVVKDGVRVVEAFNAALDHAFGDRADHVSEGIAAFIRALPLALRGHCRGGDILCAHSLPSPWMMSRFDPSILSRELVEEDYEARAGSAHLMVWGRQHDGEQLEDLVERWGVNLFVLGHEKADRGVLVIPPCAVVLNSDHERGVYWPIDLDAPPRAAEALAQVMPLSESE